MNDWMVRWCKEKLMSNDKVEDIQIVDVNHVKVKCIDSEIYNVVVTSESHIRMDLIEGLIEDNTDFLFNIKKKNL